MERTQRLVFGTENTAHQKQTQRFYLFSKRCLSMLPCSTTSRLVLLNDGQRKRRAQPAEGKRQRCKTNNWMFRKSKQTNQRRLPDRKRNFQNAQTMSSRKRLVNIASRQPAQESLQPKEINLKRLSSSGKKETKPALARVNQFSTKNKTAPGDMRFCINRLKGSRLNDNFALSRKLINGLGRF